MNGAGNNINITNDENGFTLIELLLTIIVLGIAIASLSTLFYISQITQTQTLHYDLAVRAARTEIEDLRNNGYSSLTSGSSFSFTSSLPAQLPANKSGTVVVSTPLQGLRRVDVTVTYSEYGTNETITLSSEIGVIGITQS
jgi:prepilin-type N-terminal cleavage/methylation domain-containing protein